MKPVKPTLTHRQRQALATQRLIVDTARALFLERGYGITTMDDISGKAGVSISTVYAIYKNKRGILKAIREAWHLESGQREIIKQALEEPDGARRLDLAAKATRRQWETGASMIAVYTSAAAVDAEAASELKESLAGRRAGLGHFIAQSAPFLRPDLSLERAIAIYLALTKAEVYQELVDVFGWSPDDYESWLASLLKQHLLP